MASVPATVAGTTYRQFNYKLESPELGGGEAILVLCDAETPENVQGLMAMRARRGSAEDVRARDASLQTFAGIVSELTGVQGILGEDYRTGELLPVNSGQITLPGWSTEAGKWEVIVMSADPKHEDPQVMFFIIRERADQAGR